MSVPLRILALGGLGEIGMNCLLVERGDDALIVDCGVRFPGPEAHGVDIVIPDFEPLRRRQGSLRGLFLTHGHEDHIGAVPFLLRDLQLPVYGSPFTLALLRHKLDEAGIKAELHELAPRTPVTVGAFTVEPLRVTHSIPDGFALAIGCPEGTIVHTGDFKIDHAPIDGQVTDLARLAELGERGVLCLLSDSTNALVQGNCPGERTIAPAIAEAIASAPGRVVVGLFSSNLHRVQQVAEIAHRAGRRVCLVGRSLEQNVELAQSGLRIIELPPGVLVSQDTARSLPAREVVLVCTGAQGEPRSGLVRLAFGTHPTLHLDEGDRVILSSRFIPGNELAIAALQNALARRGIDVFAEPSHRVHVSGHACQDDQRLVLRLTRPRSFVPLHGEARHLRAHRELALSCGVEPARALVAYDGEVVELGDTGPRVVEKVELGRIFVDRWSGGDVPEELVRDRGLIAECGLVTVVILLDRATGRLLREPELLSRGLQIPEPEKFWPGALRRLIEELEKMPLEMRADIPAVEEAATRAVRRHFKKDFERRPVVLPVLVSL